MMIDYSREFAGKVALVTGTSGIGRAAAMRLAAAGAKVLSCGIDEAVNAEFGALIDKAGHAIVVRRTDVSIDTDVSAAVEEAVQRFGGLACQFKPYPFTADHPGGAQRAAWACGLDYLTGRFGIPHMARRGGGAIVNISSVQGHNCQQNVAAYVATKGAIHALTRAMALDHAAARVRVNSVSPGSVRTPLLSLAARTYGGDGVSEEQAFARFGAAHPLGRIGEPEEIAELVAYLASDRAAFVTGSDFRIVAV